VANLSHATQVIKDGTVYEPKALIDSIH